MQALDRTPACRHLAGPLHCGVTYYRWLTGVGLEAELLCAECAARRESGGALEIVSICDACRFVLEEELGVLGGFRGIPGWRVRLEPIVETIDEAPLPWPLEEVLDIAPIEAEEASWLVVLRDGTVQRLDADSHSADHVCSIELPRAEPDHKPRVARVPTPRLHLSFDATFAAIVHDYGEHGRVYDLRTGRCTIELHGDSHHSWTAHSHSPSSSIGIEPSRSIEPRGIGLTPRTQEPGSGSLTAARQGYRRGERRPEHYLDYFHGRLVVSPDGQRIADDGWVWHPVGIPTVWDLGRWLDTNPWESEDGPSRMPLAGRAYFWDHGMCWFDCERIALSGIGEDDDWMVDGARVFTAAGPDSSRPDVPAARRLALAVGSRRAARELGAFAGPSGRFSATAAASSQQTRTG